MKTRLLALALAVAFVPVAHAQYDDYDYGYDYDYDGYSSDYDDYAPLTGDSTLDAVLAALNAAFNDEPEYYSQQIVYETRLQPVVVQEYIVQRHYAPADVYMIGELAQASGKSFGEVAKVYESNRAQGWGATARSLGIKPGSSQFHALKNGSSVIVQRGKGRGRANAPGQQRRAAVAQTAHPGVQGQPAKGQGKADKANKGNKGNSGKGKGNGKGNGKNK